MLTWTALKHYAFMADIKFHRLKEKMFFSKFVYANDA